MTETNEMIEQEVIETPPVVEAPKVFVYEYQATDDLGRPLGAKQVFKGATQEEILDKVAHANKELIKLNRKLKTDMRLGNVEQEVIPDGMQRMDEGALEFAPKPLTAEERIQISRDLLDPETFDAATDRLFEAKIGARPERITQVLSQAQQDIGAMRAQEEAKAFIQANPDYYICPENYKTLASWMIKNTLAPTKTNFEYAFKQLREVGLLLEAPIVREEKPEVAPVAAAPVQTPVNSQPEPEPVSRITNDEPQTQQKRVPKIASGLTRDNASSVGTTSKSTKLTVQEIESMSGDVYKKRLQSERGFAKAVDEAYAEASKRG